MKNEFRLNQKLNALTKARGIGRLPQDKLNARLQQLTKGSNKANAPKFGSIKGV